MIGALVNAITSTIVCVVSLTRNPKSRLNRSFAYFAFSVAFWAYCYFFWQLTASAQAALFWCRALMAGAIFIPSAFLHFSVTLIGQRKKYLKRVIFWYIVSLFFLILDFTPFFVKDVRPRLLFPFWPTAGGTFTLFLLMFLGVTLYSHVLMYKSYRKLSGFERNQIKYVFLGTAIGFAGGSTNYPLWYGIPILPVGNALVAIYVFTVAYAIIKYRLMDIKIAVMKTAILITVYGVIFSIPVILVTIHRSSLIAMVGERWWLIPALIYTFTITIAPFLYQALQKKAGNELLKSQRHSHTILATAARGITLIRDLDRLLGLVVRMLTKTMRLRHASIYLFDREKRQYLFRKKRGKAGDEAKIDEESSLVKYLKGVRKPILRDEIKKDYETRRDIFFKEILETMNRIDAELVIPSFIESELVGILVLGEKRSGEIFSDDDLDVLLNLANQSALAIENAQFLKEREEMQSKLRKAGILVAMSELLATFEHEMGNILGKISAPIQAIAMGEYKNKPDREKIAVDMIKTNVATMRIHVRYVREYREKTQAYIIGTHRLNGCIQRAIDHSKASIDKLNILSEANFISSKIMIKGTETLPDIFKHLIVCSVNGFGMEKDGFISYSAKVLEDKDIVEITQEDTGIDLTQEIKEPGVEGSGIFFEPGKLGGISLYLAQQIVSDHKGSFEIQSNKGKGTRFVIRLPLDFTKVSV
ncbi:MAG: histidine kinase N-terminal 7TM domain-containing protein [bacterium]